MTNLRTPRITHIKFIWYPCKNEKLSWHYFFLCFLIFTILTTIFFCCLTFFFLSEPYPQNNLSAIDMGTIESLRINRGSKNHRMSNQRTIYKGLNPLDTRARNSLFNLEHNRIRCIVQAEPLRDKTSGREMNCMIMKLHKGHLYDKERASHTWL